MPQKLCMAFRLGSHRMFSGQHESENSDRKGDNMILRREKKERFFRGVIFQEYNFDCDFAPKKSKSFHIKVLLCKVISSIIRVRHKFGIFKIYSNDSSLEEKGMMCEVCGTQ